MDALTAFCENPSRSALKPVLSALLMVAVQEGRLSSPDALVADVEPRLKSPGKDKRITWRQLASQTSGYGLSEAPGAAYSYNDFAIALYYDTLMEKVFHTNGTEVLRSRLTTPMQCEDSPNFEALGPKRQGRLALSCRDFARFGLMILREGRWGGKPLLRPDLVRVAINSPIPASTPLTGGAEAPMLPGQRTLGGSRNITPVGPGYYSFNWWLNRTNAAGQRLFAGAPDDAFAASGHGGIRVLFLVPSLDLIVCWNDARIQDHDVSPGNPETRMNRAARLIRELVASPDVTPPAISPPSPKGSPAR